jgi:hypothetical protein
MTSFELWSERQLWDEEAARFAEGQRFLIEGYIEG